MLTFLGLKYLKQHSKKIIVIPLALIISYVMTIFANTSRIYASIVVQNQANNFLPKRPHLLLHNITGIVINLTLLILTYILIERLLINKKSNEKFT